MNSLLHPFTTTLAICLLLCALGLQAQTTAKPLSNDDILGMLKAAVPETTIVLAIDLASRGARPSLIPRLPR